MHWTDEAIVLSARKHGENHAVLRLFARTHGVYGGVVRGAHSKSNRGVIQPGNVVSATWQARLSEHLGTLKAELLAANAALIMPDAARTMALSSACALIETSLPERHPYLRLYEAFSTFLATLAGPGEWLESYVKLELTLLAESGFGLDLSRCAATGSREDLIYVSPKSGRAVSRQAGEPYKEKLLSLPRFLLEGRTPTKISPVEEGSGMQETLAGLRLTGYFLEHWLAGPHGKTLPAARRRLIETIKEAHGETAQA